MLPPGFVASDGSPRGQNSGQRYLWSRWVEMAKIVSRVSPDIVVVNGDVIDGTQRAQRGTELSLPIVEDQAAAAEECLSVLRESTASARWFFTQGTEYHDQKAGREVEVVAARMGAEKYAGLGTGRHSREVLDLDVDGVVLNFSHGISCSTGLYRATAPDREGVWSALAGKEGKYPKADCVVRSHAHHFVHVEHPTKHIVITPCWQLQTRFMRRSSVYRMIPDIGAVLLTVLPDGEVGGDRVSVRKILFPLPPMKPHKV
jgi:hypothetical protein